MHDYIGKDIPKLGFGLMRLPMLGEDVDIEQTKAMVDLFLDHGYTYFDTAYGYIDGKSEEAAKTALVDRYPREKFQLATKLPAWAGAKNAGEAEEMFWTSLKRTGAGYFDYYLLHNLGDRRTKVFEDFRIWEFLTRQKEKGLIKHLGFSFHDKAHLLDEILTNHPETEFVQLQVNYADLDAPAVEARKCMEVAAKHQKPVIIMEPVKGGNLANPPKSVTALLKKAAPEASPASWALRYAASRDNVITVLSGMSAIEQMAENIDTMDNFKPLSAEEQKVIEEARALLTEIPSIPCTYCRYCARSCPQSINIPEIFKGMNAYLVFDDSNTARFLYQWATRGCGKASDCIACGQCEGVCPQHIHIIEELKKIVDVLEV